MRLFTIGYGGVARSSTCTRRWGKTAGPQPEETRRVGQIGFHRLELDP